MKKAAFFSLIISLIIHLLLASLLYIYLENYQKKVNSRKKLPNSYPVDIITLPKHRIEKKIKNEKHKVAANVSRKSVSKKFSKEEKIPLNIKTAQKEGRKQQNLHKTAKKSKKKIKALSKNGIKAYKPKKTGHKTNNFTKIKGSFYNKNAVLSNKSNQGFGLSNQKEYKSKNADREATIEIGTQSIKYASYMKHIKDKIQGVWIYPEQARVNAMQGALLLLFTIDKNGNLDRVQLIRSSGYPILDKAAMEAIKDASPFPPLPKRFYLNKLNIYATFRYTLFNYIE